MMRHLLFILFLWAAVYDSGGQGLDKRLALVIGNSNYRNGGVLKNPVNDARAIASTLQSLGFDVMKYEDVTQNEMKQAITAFGTKLKGYQVGLFYYAGHGIQEKGSNYMIPIEVDLKNEESVEYDCVAADRVLAFMETASAKVNLVILDACRNNPFERSWARSVNGNGLAQMNAPKGSLIAYATSPGRTASDGDASNGLYTSALLKYIRSSSLTIEQVFKQVRNEVSDKSGGAQIPWEVTSLTGDDFYIGKTSGGGELSRLASTATVSTAAKHVALRRDINLNAKVTPENKAQAEIYYSQGKLNYDKYEYEKANVEFGKAINLYPAYADAYYWRGNSYYGLKDYDNAVEDYSSAVEVNPNLTEAYYWRGNARFGLRQDAKALEDYTKAITQKPDYAQAYFWRGRTNYELLQDDKAIQDFDKAIQLVPSYPEAFFWRGQVYYANKKFDDAISNYTGSLALKNDDAEVLYWRANAYYSLRKYTEALVDFGSAINLKPAYADAYFFRGKVKYAKLQYAEALADFKMAAESKENYDGAYYWQGTSNYALKNYSAAIEGCTKALEINPQNADAWYYRAMSKYALKMNEDAVSDFDRSIELKPAVDAYYWRGLSKYEVQNYAEAIPDFSKSIELDPDGATSYNYYYYRGNSYYGLKMDAYAVKDFTKVISMKPEFADAWYYRACSNFYQGLNDLSLTDLNKAISLDPGNAKYSDFKTKNFK